MDNKELGNTAVCMERTEETIHSGSLLEASSEDARYSSDSLTRLLDVPD